MLHPIRLFVALMIKITERTKVHIRLVQRNCATVVQYEVMLVGE
jgi:hypothetical protein